MFPAFLGGNWTLRAPRHPWEGGNSWSQGMCCITDLNVTKQHSMRNVTYIYCPCRETVGLTGLQDLKGLRERKVKGWVCYSQCVHINSNISAVRLCVTPDFQSAVVAAAAHRSSCVCSLHRVHLGYLVHQVPEGWMGPLAWLVLRDQLVRKVQRVSRDRRWLYSHWLQILCCRH